MVGEVIVRNGNGGRCNHGVDKPVGAIREGAVIYPDVAGPEYGDPVSIGHGPPTIVSRRAPDHGVACRLAVVDVYAVDDDVGHVLNGNARAVGDVDVCPAAVDGLVAVHDELLLEDDDHVALEHDPEWLVLDDGVAKGPRPRVHGVIVGRVGHDVDAAVTATNGFATKPDAAVGEPLAVVGPVRVATPAVVDGIARAAGEVAQRPSPRAVFHDPAPVQRHGNETLDLMDK
uniref:Uncharacterized protein n=1 Tax=Nymphaea colorata TaxID=210225 RepID=A0A5K1CVU7_9MAGN